MTDEDIPNPMPLELNLGESEISYPELPKDWMVESVTIKGMRGKDMKLIRMRPADLARYSPSLRGLPTQYSIDFKNRKLRFLPAAVGSFTVFLHLRNPHRTSEERQDALALPRW